MKADAISALDNGADSARATSRLRPADPVAIEALPPMRSSSNAWTASLGILAALATVAALAWAQDFVIPLLLGVLIAYTLYPLVAGLRLLRVPRVIGAIVVLSGLLGALGFGAYSLRGQMQAIIGGLPEAAAKMSGQIARLRVDRVGSLQTVQSAATVVEKAATQAAGGPAVPRQAATHVIVDQPKFRLDDFLWKRSLGSLGALAEAATVIVLAFFLLLSGETFKRNVVRLSEASPEGEQLTLQVMHAINGTIQKYLLMLLATNVLVALLTWLAFRVLGLENAGAWAVAAGIMHVIPYLGPALTAAAVGIAAFVQFDSMGMALLVGGASLAVAAVIGTLVTTWMAGRIADVNPAVVFIALMFWGWLWGIPGMLLSVPIVAIARVLSQHVKRLAPLGTLLGGSLK
jgi:predicted PurR-regulated permease PerM